MQPLCICCVAVICDLLTEEEIEEGLNNAECFCALQLPSGGGDVDLHEDRLGVGEGVAVGARSRGSTTLLSKYQKIFTKFRRI